MSVAVQVPVELPHLERLRWRVDVVLSTSSVSRVLRPSVLLRATLTDGTVSTFELNLKSFHELRHAVAEALHSVDAATPKLAAGAEKAKASAPNEDDLDAAFAALADARGAVTAASLLAVSNELNFGWSEEDARSMLQLFGAGRSLSRAEFAQVAAAVRARVPAR